MLNMLTNIIAKYTSLVEKNHPSNNKEIYHRFRGLVEYMP